MLTLSFLGLFASMVGFTAWVADFSGRGSSSIWGLILCFIGAIGNTYVLATELANRNRGSK